MKKILKVLMTVGLVVLPQIEMEAQETGQQSSINKQTFESRFWTYLLSNNYKNWAPPAGQGGDFFAGETPHGQLQKIYLNRTAASSPDLLDDESVIVLENYSDNRELESISVMLRSAGSNPLERDWYWITYGPDGSVLQSSARNDSDEEEVGPKTSLVSTTGSLLVKNTCSQCHRKAPGNDFVFFNGDDAATALAPIR